MATVQSMLATLLEETDDSEVQFKLRTSLQPLKIIEEQHEAGRNAIGDRDLDEEVRANLQELGYLE